MGPGAGGWAAVLRTGETVDEEALCLALPQQDGVALRPGSSFDLERAGHLVVSLLPAPEVVQQGRSRLAARLALG